MSDNGYTVQTQIGIIREYREGEDHLIYLGVAVASDGNDLIPISVKKLDDPLRCIGRGQVVSRAVIKQIAEKEHLVAFFILKDLEKLGCAHSITVYIGSNKQFHIISPFTAILSYSAGKGKGKCKKCFTLYRRET